MGTLARWLAERGNPPVYLAYFAAEPPKRFGIRGFPLPGCEPVSGLVAISVSVLQGQYAAGNPFERPPEGCYDWLREHEPVATPGYSIHVYDTSKPGA